MPPHWYLLDEFINFVLSHGIWVIKSYQMIYLKTCSNNELLVSFAFFFFFAFFSKIFFIYLVEVQWLQIGTVKSKCDKIAPVTFASLFYNIESSLEPVARYSVFLMLNKIWPDDFDIMSHISHNVLIWQYALLCVNIAMFTVYVYFIYFLFTHL